MGDVLKKFGRYFLLDRIAQGGMAEIYRARLATLDGPGRLLVIKRIQQGLGSNSEFVSMFKSEIQVTMGFNHPNIVQVYDFGEEHSQPYIAMEFVDGRNLRQFLLRFAEVKQMFPVDLAAYIIEQAASGLQYAHAFKDKITGVPLNIIHRDISPQNIIISYEGNVKVIDFGIAKATVNSEATRAGIIKGKPSYLSPEQISGEELDSRCDLFSLGTVLWELLTGKKLFAGDNDLQVLKMIEAATTYVKPPSTLNPEVPKELDYIVLKALAKQRELRYQSADEMRRALHRFVYSFNPDFNPGDLAYYAKDLFKNEIVEDRKRIQKLNDKAESLLAAGPDQTLSGETRSQDSNSGDIILKREDTTTVFEVNQKEKPTDVSLPVNVPPVAPLAAQGGTRVVKSPPFQVKGAKSRSVELEATPARAFDKSGAIVASSSHHRGTRDIAFSSSYQRGVESDTRRKSEMRSKKTWTIPSVAAVFAIAIGTLVYVGPRFGVGMPEQLDRLRGPAATATASLHLIGSAKGVDVRINGVSMANELPAHLPNVSAGQPLTITVAGAAGSFKSVLQLDPGENRSINVVLASDVLPVLTTKMVNLKLDVVPTIDLSSVKATLNGKPVDVRNPIAVPVDQPLHISLDRPGSKTVQKEFVVASSAVGSASEYRMEFALEELHYGFLTIRTTPSSDAILNLKDARSPSSDHPISKHTPFENEKIPVGTYQVRLVNEVLGMEKTVTIVVQEGHQTSVEERLEVK